MKPQEMTIQHAVMGCPVCGETITATVHITPHLGEPRINGSGEVTVPTSAEMTRYHVTHHCGGPVLAADPEDSQ